jgi:uncharacterized membrane protein YidH (DUF202 family)
MSNGADGASAERTRLAWRRTTLAATVATLLTVRLAVRVPDDPWHITAIVLAALLWLGQLVLTQRRIRAMDADPPRGIGRTLPVSALMYAGNAVLCVALVLTTPLAP